MNQQELEDILEEDHAGSWQGDNALQGLKVISEYFPDKTVLQGADHDIIYSVDAVELIEAGLTDEHAWELSRLNWMITDDYLACYV